jgi:hypothetical protein
MYRFGFPKILVHNTSPPSSAGKRILGFLPDWEKAGKLRDKTNPRSHPPLASWQADELAASSRFLEELTCYLYVVIL